VKTRSPSGWMIPAVQHRPKPLDFAPLRENFHRRF
jgi:hypothetical protein